MITNFIPMHFCCSFRFVDARCWVSGWGKNDFASGTYQTIQKEVDVPILPPSTCQTALSATRLGPTFVFDSSSFICAGGEIGKDACTVSSTYYFANANNYLIFIAIGFLSSSGRRWFAARVPIEWTMVCCWFGCMGYRLCRYQHSRCLCQYQHLHRMDSINNRHSINICIVFNWKTFSVFVY